MTTNRGITGRSPFCVRFARQPGRQAQIDRRHSPILPSPPSQQSPISNPTPRLAKMMIDFDAVMMYNGCATVRRTEAIFLFDPPSFCTENNPHIIKTEAYQPNRPSVCRRKANEDRAGAPLAFLNQNERTPDGSTSEALTTVSLTGDET